MEVVCVWQSAGGQGQIHYTFRKNRPSIIAHAGSRLKIQFRTLLNNTPVKWLHAQTKWTGPLSPVYRQDSTEVNLRLPKEPGTYPLPYTYELGDVTAHDELLILIPYPLPGPSESLDGFTIGPYPDPASPRAVSYVTRYHKRYQPPAAFVRVDTANKDCHVSNLFTLSDFMIRQGPSVQYLPLSYSLLDKLDKLASALDKEGYPGRAMVVIEGYRTPALNRVLSGAPYSRHMYGDAAAIIIDEDQDGRMDDLNQDGIENFEDVLIIGKLLLALEKKSKVVSGGIGLYQEPAGCKIDVDTRGFPSRWGIQDNREITWWTP